MLLTAAASCQMVQAVAQSSLQRRNPEEDAAHPFSVALFIKMLCHAQLEHVAEYGQLLSLFQRTSTQSRSWALQERVALN